MEVNGERRMFGSSGYLYKSRCFATSSARFSSAGGRRFSLPASASDELVSDDRKRTVFFNAADLDELKREAARLDRSVSWVTQRAWKIARRQVRAIPASPSVKDDDPARGSS